MSLPFRPLKPYVGTRSQRYRAEVKLSLLKGFCGAVGIAETPLAPPTFLTLFRQGEDDLFRQLEINLSKLLHTQQDYQYLSPIEAGDVLEFETELTHVLEKIGTTGSTQFITLETEFRICNPQTELLSGGEAQTQVAEKVSGPLAKKVAAKSKSVVVIRHTHS